MRLKKAQKEAVLKWVAAGLPSNEISAKASRFKPPFEVSKQQVDYYRRTRKQDVASIRAVDEKTALTKGYAIKGFRVYKLSQLASLLESDLFNGFVWLDQEKGIGSGDQAKIVEYEEFNAAEIAQYRGILDDIAKETGGREKNIDIKSDGEKIIVTIGDG